MSSLIHAAGPSRSGTTRTQAPLVALVVAIVLAALGAAPASAHDALVSSTPGDGDALPSAPDEIELTFTGEIQDISPQLIISDAEGVQVASIEPVVDGTVVTAPVEADLTEGAYDVTWRVVSSDGHPIAGRLSFSIGDAAPAETDAVEPESGPDQGAETTSHGSEDHGVLGGHGEHIAMGAGAVALALLGVGGVVLRRRRG
ncbi:copper resistance CopC family protein [uncultured Serinicoccus sp.]|uniref:copper resistance CopC family protein n=1 Tax=uncultured Serinicoccus sp. TaxID=735514 RepID=UPI00260171BE|nr:copper resistance CopC family protein [uncultured Serinicoccus sp.]